MTRGKREPAETRFWAFVHFEPTSGCWLWSGSGSDGYGTFWINGRMLGAHRVSFMLHKGQIPKGMVLDHLCRNGMCVNPDHLEVVTIGQNVLRGVGTSATNARKQHCKRGHLFTEENTWRQADGGRHCRQCTRERQARYYRESETFRTQSLERCRNRRARIKSNGANHE